MEARYKPVRRLFGDKRGAVFKVPEYQRGYEWEKKHWRDLWSDLNKIDSQVDQHYLGNIILLEQESGQVYEIVDGQQRMVTLSLLMMAIRDSPDFDSWDEGELDDVRMEDVLETNRGDDPIPKLKLSDEEAHTQYSSIWNRDTDGLEGQVKDSYDYFYGKVSGLENSELERLVDNICNYLQVVETVSTDTSLAYNIFQSQNERGKEVSPQILAKARIHGAAADLDDEQKSKEVTGRWNEIYRQLERELGSPRFQKRLRVRRPMTQIIVNSNVPTSTQIDKSELYRYFENVLNSYDDVQEFVEWFDKQVQIYLQISSNSYEISGHDIPNDSIRHLQYLNSASTHSEALSLAIFNEIDDDVLLEENFRLASILAMRMELSSTSSADTRDAIYGTAREVRQTEDQNDIRQTLRDCIDEYTPTDGEITEYLKANQLNVRGAWNFRTLLTLVSIEEARRGPWTMDIEDLHIEHIAPRKSYEKPEYRDWRKNLNDDHYHNQRDKLGNLTLLLDSHHASVDETSFASKKQKYSESDVKIAEEVAHYDNWTSEDIETRTEELAEELIERWTA